MLLAEFFKQIVFIKKIIKHLLHTWNHYDMLSLSKEMRIINVS